MQAVITHPDGVEAGIDSQSAGDHIDVSHQDVESVIRRSKNLTSIERLHIYANAYYLRLVECLREEFPAMTRALGEEAFNGLAFSYLQQFPSTSYTLNDLGKNFAEHLEASRPPRDDPDDDTPDWADFLIDVARLERLYGEVFDGPGIEKREVLQTDDLLRIPPKDWPRVRLTTAPCLCVARFRFPVHEFVSAVRNDEEGIAPPRPATTHLAVSRLHYRVRRWELTEPQFRLLEALNAGRPLQSAIETAFTDSDAADAVLGESLRLWFQEWSESGFFVAAEVDR